MSPTLGCSSGLSQAAAATRSTWEGTGGLCAGVWCLLGDTGGWTVPVVPTMFIHHIHSGASALGSDFVCNLSLERPLSEPRVRAKGA